MVKATLRSSNNAPPTIDVESSTVADPNLVDMIAGEAGAKADMETGGASQRGGAQAVEKYKPKPMPRVLEPTEGFEGEWDGSDLKFPQLKLVQGSGPLSTLFDVGTLVYADEELLPPPSTKKDVVNPVLRFVPLAIQKQWREKLTQEAIGEGNMPRVVETVDDVEELGGTTRWVGNEQPDNYWEPSARCLLLIELPEGNEHPAFPNLLDNKQYAIAVYYAGGGAYRDFAKIIYNAAKISLLTPVLIDGKPKLDEKGRPVKHTLLYKNFWIVSFSRKQVGNFTPWRPTAKLLREETGPEVRAFCEDLIRGALPAAVEA